MGRAVGAQERGSVMSMNAQTRLTGLTTEQAREVTAILSQRRTLVTSASARLAADVTGAPEWAPAMTCEGPSHWTVYLPTMPASVAADILASVTR